VAEWFVVGQCALEEYNENPALTAAVTFGDVGHLGLIVITVGGHDVNDVIGRPVADAITSTPEHFSIGTNDLVRLLPARAGLIVRNLGLESSQYPATTLRPRRICVWIKPASRSP
jgi:hypothetical protein